MRDSRVVVPPPLPPKTPLPGQEREREVRRLRKQGNLGGLPPYPLDDAPPVVNMARRPEGWGR